MVNDRPERGVSILTLTTDFGADSPYVAEMKASILRIWEGAPNALQLVDITHSIQPQNVMQGAVVLADIAPQFPSGTVHLAVIDPGVGTERKILAARVGPHIYVCPDNGLLSELLIRSSDAQLHVVEDPRYFSKEVSSTFHGRDIMAPVAASLARGVPVASLGPPLQNPVRIDCPRAECGDRRVRGQILWADSFGNLISNIRRDDGPQALTDTRRGKAQGHIAGVTISRTVRTYGEAAEGELVMLFGSAGRLEISQVNGNACRQLLGGRDPSGVEVILTFSCDP